MFKRVLAFFLVFALFVGTMPVNAFAQSKLLPVGETVSQAEQQQVTEALQGNILSIEIADVYRTYDGTSQKLSFKANDPGIVIKGLLAGHTATFTANANGKNAGEYDFSLKNDEVVVKDTSGNNVTAQYTAKDISGKLIIEKAATLRIVVDNKQISFGGEIPKLTYSVIGLMSTDTVKSAEIITELSTDYKVGDPVGVYPIFITPPTSKNYTFISPISNGTLTVKTKNYTVTYNLGGDNVVNPNETSYDGRIDVTLIPPTRVGYTFKEWTATGVTLVDGKVIPKGTTGSITLTAVWEINNYTITFNGNGGTPANTIVKADYNTVVTLPITPKRTGYRFAGWNTKADGTGTDFTGETKVTDDITVYAQWVIGKTELTITISDVTATYTGISQKTVVEAGDNISGAKVEGLLGGDTITAFKVTASGKNAGEYEFVLNKDVVIKNGTKNITDQYKINIVYGKLIIKPAPLSVTAEDNTVPRGNVAPDFTVKYSGLVEGEDESFLKGNLKFSTDYITASPAGTYKITPSGFANTKNYAITFKNGILTVTDIVATPLTITVSDVVKTYNGISQREVVEAGDSTGIVVEGLLEGHTLTFKATASGKNAGEYVFEPNKDIVVKADKIDVTAKYAITVNYGKLTVDPALLTITAQDKIIKSGDDVPDFTAEYSGFVESEDESFLKGTLKFSTDYTVTSPVGEYDILPSGLANTKNYDITFKSGKLTVTPATLNITLNDYNGVYDAAQHGITVIGAEGATIQYKTDIAGSWSATAPVFKDTGEYTVYVKVSKANYTDFEGNAKVKITARPITITVSGATKVYDGTPLTANTAVLTTGTFAGSETIGILNLIYSGSQTAVGSSAGSATTGNTNYNVTVISGTLTVTARPVTITVSGATKVYDGTALIANVAVLTSGTFAVGETIGTLNLIYSGSQTAVGSSACSATTGNANYNVTVIPGTLTVTARPITITVSNATKVYDGTALTANAATLTTGTFVGSETIGTLNFIYSGSQTAVGSSACSATTGNTNYNVTIIPGTLTVTARPVTITVRDVTKTYNGTSQKIVTDGTGIDVNGLIEGYTLTFKATAKGKNVGEYSFEVGEEPIIKAGETVVTDNYTIVISYGQLIIEPAPLSITADSKTIVTGSDVPIFTAKYSGFVDGEDESFLKGTIKFSTDYTKTSPSGSYHIILSGFANTKNYKVVFTDGMLTVTDKDITVLTITVRDVTKTYNGISQKIVADDNAGIDVEGLAGGHTLTFKATAGGKNVGEYPFEVNKNVVIKSGKIDVTERYTVTVNYGKLTIEPALLTITAQDRTISTGAAVPTFTAGYSDFAEGEDATFLKGKLNFSTEYTKTSPEGEYDIIPSGFEKTENYAIVFVKGKLTVGAVADKYTVTFVDHKGNTIGTPQTVVSGGSATAPIASDRSGYYFKEWDKPFTSVTTDLTITAVYDTWFEFTETSGAITITKYKSGAPNDVVIPAKFDDVDVLHIGAKAFYECDSLTTVTIPDSVITIEVLAFSGCLSLTSVIIPNSVVAIGTLAFSNCQSLTSINIPNGVTKIMDGTFSSCYSLTTVTIPNSVTTIGVSVLNYGSPLLSDIVFPPPPIINPPTVLIVYGAFSNCRSLTSINIPNGVITIGEYTFNHCDSLTTVTIPDSVTAIGSGAFYSCDSLTSVIIPNGVTAIRGCTFEYCSSLTTVTIPNSVVAIGYWAFGYCSSLTTIIIPDSVTAIGFGAFSNCEFLTSINIPTGVTTIEDYTFSGCSSLTAVTIPDSVTSIGEYSFAGCTELKEVSVSRNIASMSITVFDNNPALKTINIRNYQHLVPTAVTDNEPWGAPATTIVKYLSDILGTFTVTFVDHKGKILKEQTVESGNVATAPTDDEITKRSGYYFKKWDRPFTSVTANLTITAEYDTWFEFTQTGGVITITGYKPDAPNDVVIPAKFDDVDVLHIGATAFKNDYYNSTSITSVIIPNSIVTIGTEAFYYCYSLTTITVPDSVTSISDQAFGSCTGLKEVSVSKNISYMPTTVFSGDIALEIIEVRNSKVNVPTAVTDNEPWGAPQTTIIEYLSDISGTFTVTFVDHKGKVLKVQEIESGNAATAPIDDEITERSGYYFKKWDRAFTRVRADLTVTAEYDTWFEFTEDDRAITITGYKSDAPRDVVIPAKFDDVDVLHIGGWAFYYYYYHSSITSIIIPNTVVTIGEWAFAGCYSLTSITIPNSVTTIGDGAFHYLLKATDIFVDENNQNFKSIDGILYDKAMTTAIQCPAGKVGNIVIPNSVVTIGDWSFKNCYYLTTVTIPNSITTIGNGAFFNCGSLTSVIIPNGVPTIGDSTFERCYSLTAITIPDSVTSIGDYAFSNCTKLEQVSISKNIESMPATVFAYDDDLKTIDIRNYQHLVTTAVTDNEPWGAPTTTVVKYLNDITGTFTVTFVDHKGNTIGTPEAVVSGGTATAPIPPERSGYYFKEWDKPFTSVTANLTVTAVYDTWFEFTEAGGVITITGYKSGAPNDVVIPAKFDDVDVLHIGVRAFENTSLISVIIPDSVITIRTSAFSNCHYLSSITIPDSITAIGVGAFFRCSALTSVNIPNKLTTTGDSAFAYCSSLTTVTIPNSVTSIGYSTFSGCSSLTIVTIPNSVVTIGAAAFGNCYLLTSITIPNSVTAIGRSAFSGCQSLTSITIPNGVTTIEDFTFGSCYSLTTITIPNSITRIGCDAFNACSSLTAVTIPDSVTAIGSGAFYNCGSLTSVNIPNGVTTIEDSMFGYCYSLLSITIPNSVTSIGDRAFFYCCSLTTVTIPDSVTTIEGGAFGNLTNITEIFVGEDNQNFKSVDGILYDKAMVTVIQCSAKKTGDIIIPNTVTDIVAYAFSGCSFLTSVIIPNGVTTIKEGTFDNCCFLTSITIPNNVTAIGRSAFSGCQSLTSITIPNSVTTIGDLAFCACYSLVSIVISDSVTAIGNGAFTHCKSLTSINIPNGITTISEHTFYNCNSLIAVTIPDSVTRIEYYAFNNCTKLEEVSISKDISHMPATVFNNNTALKTIHIRNHKANIPTAVTDSEPWGAPPTTIVTYLNDI